VITVDTAAIGSLAGGVLVLLSALLLHLAAPHQQWGALPVRPALCGWSGAGALAIGTALLLGWAGPATAIFIALTLLMTVWSIVPVAIAWWRFHRQGARQ